MLFVARWVRASVGEEGEAMKLEEMWAVHEAATAEKWSSGAANASAIGMYIKHGSKLLAVAEAAKAHCAAGATLQVNATIESARTLFAALAALEEP